MPHCKKRLLIAGIVLLLPAFFISLYSQDLQQPIPEFEYDAIRSVLQDMQSTWSPPTSGSIVNIAAVGDLMMSSWIIDVVNERGVDFPFDSTRRFIETADVAIANLEAPFTTSNERFEDKKYTFKVPPHFVKGIVNAGFDVVTMANNHIVDFGCKGLYDTISTLEKMGLYYCGAGADRQQACAPTIFEMNGVKLAFIGFSMTYPDDFWATSMRCGTCYPTEAQLYHSIAQAEKAADFTIVSFHWGAEKHTTPRAYQIKYGRLAIDYGADLVLGHHPHVLQGLELYQGKLIAYSLGNYVFASYSNTAKTSIVLRARINQDGLILAKVIPINVHNSTINFQPVELRGTEKHNVLDDLNAISRPLNNGRLLIDNEGYISPSKIIYSMKKTETEIIH
jgi:poly-gamma-glutamate synthesis protein (capsule biosynthesis protein)